MPGRAYPKHAIKRVDRLLGNHHLQAERSLFYWHSGRGSNSRKTLERLEHALRDEVCQQAQVLE